MLSNPAQDAPKGTRQHSQTAERRPNESLKSIPSQGWIPYTSKNLKSGDFLFFFSKPQEAAMAYSAVATRFWERASCLAFCQNLTPWRIRQLHFLFYRLLTGQNESTAFFLLVDLKQFENHLRFLGASMTANQCFPQPCIFHCSGWLSLFAGGAPEGDNGPKWHTHTQC